MILDLNGLEDRHSLDRKFTFFLKKTDKDSKDADSPKPTGVQIREDKGIPEIERSANELIDKFFSIDRDTLVKSFNDKCLPFEVTSKAFKCLYQIAHDDKSKCTIIKKHEMFLVKLIEIRKLEFCLDELIYLQGILDRSVNVKNLGESIKRGTQIILKGISFNETYLECLEESCKADIVNATIAFNFLTLQCFLHMILHQLKSSTFKKKEHLEIILAFPDIFLSTSNFLQWTYYAARFNLNLEKHSANILKILSGALRMISFIKSKFSSDYNAELRLCEKKLKLKTMQYELSLNQLSILTQFKVCTEDVFHLRPFISDFKDNVTSLGLKADSYLFVEQAKSKNQFSLDLSFLAIAEHIENVTANISEKDSEKLEFILSTKNELFDELMQRRDALAILKHMLTAISNSKSTSFHRLVTLITHLLRENLMKMGLIYKDHLIVLDCIIVYIKCLLEQTCSSDLIVISTVPQILDNLFDVFSKYSQFKRIRNVSDLQWAWGRNFPNVQTDFLVASVKYERNIFQNYAAHKSLECVKMYQNKAEKASLILVSSNNFDDAFQIICNFFADWFNIAQETDRHILDTLRKFKFPGMLGCLKKCLLNSTIFLEKLLGESSNLCEGYKVVLVLNLMKVASEKDSDEFLQLIDLLERKVNVKDSLMLSLLFYYKRKYCHFSEALSETAPLETIDEPLSQLYISGAYFCACTRLSWKNQWFDLSLVYLENWVKSNTSIELDLASDHVNEILLNHIQFLRQNSLNGYIVFIAELVRTHKPEIFISKAYKCLALILYLELGEAYMELGILARIPSSLSSAASLIKGMAATDDEDAASVSLTLLVDWKILQLKFCILQNNWEQSLEKFSKLLSFFESNTDFDLKSTGANKTFEVKLTNLLMIAKFQLSTSMLNLSLARHVESLCNAKVAIKLLYSIVKKLNSQNDVITNLYIKWESVRLLFDAYEVALSIYQHFGITRDIAYFVGEFKKLYELIQFPFMKSEKAFILFDYLVWLEEGDNAKSILDEANLIVESFQTILIDLKYYQFHANILYHKKFTSLTFECNLSLQALNLEYEAAKDSLLLKDSEAVPDSIKQFAKSFNLFSEESEFEYRSSMIPTYEPHVKLESYSVCNPRQLILDLLVQTKLELRAANSLFKSLLRWVENAILSVPCISEISDQSQILSAKGESENLKANVLANLIKIKDILYHCLQNNSLKLLKNREIRDFSYIFNWCMSLASSIAFLNDVSLPLFGSTLSVNSFVYFLQDLPRGTPFQKDLEIRECREFIMPFDNDLLPRRIGTVNLGDETDSDFYIFQDDIKNFLPNNWNIVSIDICPYSGHLLVSRMSSSGEPLFLRLPSMKAKQNDYSFSRVLDRQKYIIKKSDESTRPEITSNVKSKEERKKWWKLRFQLDLELQDLLQEVEENWFGAFKSILCCDAMIPESLLDEFRNELNRLLAQYLPSRKFAPLGQKHVQLHDQILNQIVLCGANFVDEKTNLDKDIDSKIEMDYLNDIFHFIIQILELHGEVNNESQIDYKSFSNVLRSLIVRCYKKKCRMDILSSQTQKHLVLILNSECSNFPWESLNCLQGKSISRMPSMRCLLDCLKNNRKLSIEAKDIKKTFYIVNPDGDLNRTERNFEPIFSKMPGWTGYSGKAPHENIIINNLTEKNLFIYLGHGGCEQYVRTSELFKATSITRSLPPSLLIGCSSGNLNCFKWLESFGTALSWISCGSPMILANLWDVTDKDIDKFSLSVFQKWGVLDPEGGTLHLNICDAVETSRKECNLRYLNGSAPVVYGLPIIID